MKITKPFLYIFFIKVKTPSPGPKINVEFLSNLLTCHGNSFNKSVAKL